MKFMQASSVLLLSALVLAGCGKQPSDTPDAPAGTAATEPTEAAPAAPAVAAIGKEGSAQEGPYGLTVAPGEVFQCAGRDKVASKVNWKIEDESVGSMVEVYVIGPGQAEGKLFAKGGLKGEAETGNWVYEGTRFVVKDTAGKELVAYQVAGLPCQ
jgi:hypothetical protein